MERRQTLIKQPSETSPALAEIKQAAGRLKRARSLLFKPEDLNISKAKSTNEGELDSKLKSPEVKPIIKPEMKDTQVQTRKVKSPKKEVQEA